MALSREEILAMPAGRELDALVAEKVMGWRRITGPKTDYYGPCEYGDVLIPPTVTEEEAFRMMPPKGTIPFYYFVNRNWSSDISAAWEVVEKMKRNDWVFVINSISEEWTALFYLDRIHEHEVTCNSAPEAICKAALLAIMNGGDNQ